MLKVFLVQYTGGSERYFMLNGCIWHTKVGLRHRRQNTRPPRGVSTHWTLNVKQWASTCVQCNTLDDLIMARKGVCPYTLSCLHLCVCVCVCDHVCVWWCVTMCVCDHVYNLTRLMTSFLLQWPGKSAGAHSYSLSCPNKEGRKERTLILFHAYTKEVCTLTLFFTHPASITLARKSVGLHSFLPIIRGMMSLIACNFICIIS